MSEVKRTRQAHERLTQLCDEMTKVLDREENSDVKAVIMLQDGARGGMVLHGYAKDGRTDDEASSEAFADVFIHLGAIFKASGKTLMLLGEDGSTILGGPHG